MTFFLHTEYLFRPVLIPFCVYLYFSDNPLLILWRCRQLSELPRACALEDYRPDEHSLGRLAAGFTSISSPRPSLLLRVLAKSKTRTSFYQNNPRNGVKDFLILAMRFSVHKFSVLDLDPDPHRSTLRWPPWIRIRIRDADSGSESRSCKIT